VSQKAFDSTRNNLVLWLRRNNTNSRRAVREICMPPPRGGAKYSLEWGGSKAEVESCIVGYAIMDLGLKSDGKIRITIRIKIRKFSVGRLAIRTPVPPHPGPLPRGEGGLVGRRRVGLVDVSGSWGRARRRSKG